MFPRFPRRANTIYLQSQPPYSPKCLEGVFYEARASSCYSTRARNVPKKGTWVLLIEGLRGPGSYYLGSFGWGPLAWYALGAIEGGFCFDGSTARKD